MTAQASRTMFRISKKLEECFKQVSLFSCHFLAKSNRYREQYLNQFKKMSGKDQTDRQRRQKARHKQQKQKIKQEIKRLKQRYRGSRYQDDRKQKDQQKYRGRQKQRQRQKDRHRSHHRDRSHHGKHHRKQPSKDDNSSKYKHRSFSYQKQKEANQIEKQLNLEKSKQKKVVSQLQKQRQFDFDKDQSFQVIKKADIYQQVQSEEHKKSSVIKSSLNVDRLSQRLSQRPSFQLKRPSEKVLWSKRNIQTIGCENPHKYKILRIDEKNSDFQDQNAPIKVPQIKPRQPLTPYFLFLRKNRYKIQNQYPNVVQLGSLINIWKKLSDELKRPYIEEYTRASQIYSKLLMQYNAIHNPEQSEKQNKKNSDFYKNQKQKIQSQKRKRRDDDQQYQSRPRKKNQSLLDLDQFDL